MVMPASADAGTDAMGTAGMHCFKLTDNARTGGVRHAVALAAIAACLTAMPACAYTGPGLGLGAITSAVGIVFGILLALVGLIWYPIKRAIRMLRGGSARKPAPKPAVDAKRGTDEQA